MCLCYVVYGMFVYVCDVGMLEVGVVKVGVVEVVMCFASIAALHSPSLCCIWWTSPCSEDAS